MVEILSTAKGACFLFYDTNSALFTFWELASLCEDQFQKQRDNVD
jgi:hypothetical protein